MADEEKLKRYREHNVTRHVDGKHVSADPNPHDMRCQCEDCRDITRRYSRTVANEQGEK